MNPIKLKDADKVLKNQGYKPIRQSGSHLTYNNGNQSVTITNSREISPGVWRNILKLIGIK
jgi:predicted RNA binding protein YcfA (HicA-like mRNA interferase family)